MDIQFGLCGGRSSFHFDFLSAMKKVFGIVLGILTGWLFVSCEQPTMLSVSQTALSFENGGGNQSVTLTANKVWTASSNQGWLRVSPSSGEGNAALSVSCEGNSTYDTRTGTITIVSEELTQTISVTQTEGQGLLISQSEYNLSNEAQTIDVTVQANVQYAVDIDNACRDWIKQESTKGLSSNTIKFAISKNESYDSREGKITIRQTNGSLSSTVTIKQSQLDGLFLTTSEYNLSNEKHTLTVEVNTNVEFDVKPEADWVKYVQTKGLSTKQIVLEVAENDTYDQRETKVNVKQKNGDLSGTITIKQDEKYGILVSQPEYNLNNEAATIDVEVKYNVDFEVVIPDDCKAWIKQVSTKSLNRKTYTFSIAKNETYDNREGSITFKQKNGAISTTVAIKQAQTNGLIAEKTQYEVSDKEQALDIKVKSNIEYEVQIDDSCKDWISRVQTKGLTEFTVSLMIAENTGKDTRTGIVVLKNSELEERISILQKGKVVEFEDANFKAYCIENFDTDGDGEISLTEAETVTKLYVGTKKIASVKGIEYFENLESLSCEGGTSESSRGLLTSIDVCKNTKLKSLYLYGNQIKEIDISKNAELTYISVSYNQLSSLDCSHCPKLRTVYCNNNLIEELIVNNNPLLTDLSCKDNHLNNLDASSCDKGICIYCRHNPDLKTIWLRKEQYIPLPQGLLIRKFDVAKVLVKYVDYPFIIFNDNNFESYCLANFDADGDGKITYDDEALAVKSINCSSKEIYSLEGTEYFVNLEELDCSHNSIEQMERYHYYNKQFLKRFDCSYNALNTVAEGEIYTYHNPKLTYLDCSNNEKLDYLDIGDSKELEYVNCEATSVWNLVTSSTPKIKYLNCIGSNVSSLDLSSNVELVELRVGGRYRRNFQSLNVKNCTELEVLECWGDGDNPGLSELDVSSCKKLKNLGVRNNHIKNINLRSNTELRYIDVGCNQLASLDVSKNPLLETLYCSSNAISKLDVSNHHSLIQLQCNNNVLTSLNVSNCSVLQELYCTGNQLTSLNVSSCPALRDLECYRNQIASLNVGSNTLLFYLACQRNQLTELEVTYNSALEHLDFGYNKITTIDLSHNSELEYLCSEYNTLTDLDVSHNAKLRKLYCTSNQLSVLDVSSNMALTNLGCTKNPFLKEIWLKKGQTINAFAYDTDVATIKYK